MNILSFETVEKYLAYKQVYFKKEITDIDLKTVVNSGKVYDVGKVEIRRISNERIAFYIFIEGKEISIFEYKTDLEFFAWIRVNFIPVGVLVNKYMGPAADLDDKQEKLSSILDQSRDVDDRSWWWLRYGKVGASSLTMWGCMMDQKRPEVYYPMDPDDFSRCYYLLETVPEWKANLDKLKVLSREWEILVENWVKLTYMYRKILAHNSAHRVGIMYKYMKILSTEAKERDGAKTDH